MYINIIKLFFGVWLLSYTLMANAYNPCKPDSGGGTQTVYVNFGTISVPRDIPIGGEIAYGLFGASKSDAFFCDAATYQLYYSLTYGSKTKEDEHVYATNLKGVGIKVLNNTSQYGNIDYYESPPSTETTPNTATTVRINSPYVQVFLIKTGEIETGSLATGNIGEYYISDKNNVRLVTVTNIIMQGGKIAVTGCSLNTPALSFTLSDINSNEFGTTVGYIPPETDTQNIDLECDPNVNIYASLSGVKNPDLNDPSVLALTGQGEEGVAKGVGIQLLFKKKLLKVNKDISLKTTNGGVESLPITAQYYQTLSKVTAGSANSSATLVLTYQ
ncbi:fimbrial protein [Citrobacter farmeri]|uniref:fimbrial protein n=1 Tax=Citrobacter farmeri TaxID=67824 RepID=UPI001907154A|nr:fimbrial protein [Citrobacter farmeri]MBJ9163926.1 fimbrial protein [Citrobacter farmeri]